MLIPAEMDLNTTITDVSCSIYLLFKQCEFMIRFNKKCVQ